MNDLAIKVMLRTRLNVVTQAICSVVFASVTTGNSVQHASVTDRIVQLRKILAVVRCQTRAKSVHDLVRVNAVNVTVKNVRIRIRSSTANTVNVTTIRANVAADRYVPGRNAGNVIVVIVCAWLAGAVTPVSVRIIIILALYRAVIMLYVRTMANVSVDNASVGWTATGTDTRANIAMNVLRVKEYGARNINRASNVKPTKQAVTMRMNVSCIVQRSRLN